MAQAIGGSTQAGLKGSSTKSMCLLSLLLLTLALALTLSCFEGSKNLAEAVSINIWKHRYPYTGGGHGYYPYWGGYYRGAGGYGGISFDG